MIDRYSRPGMAAIWTPENKYKTWLEVEILAAEAVGEHIGPSARYLHWGLTSSDMLDTAMAVLFRQAMEIILDDVDLLMDVIKRRAFVTFGLKLAVWYDEMQRNRRRLEDAKETISYGKISGAVGTFAHVDPRVESHVCKHLGLKPAPASNQIIQRDRYADVFCTLAVLASSVEKMATEVRHLQRTEVLEAEEYFGPFYRNIGSLDSISRQDGA